MEPLLTVTLPIELTNGNQGRGGHWAATKRRRDDYESLIILMGHRRKPFDCPVRIQVTRLRGRRQRAWDSDSWQRGNLKEIIDSLVACGWFHGDDRRWIAETTFNELAFGKHGYALPATRIDVLPFVASQTDSDMYRNQKQ